MKIAYFDCFAGISGDMILGAMIDAGLNINSLKYELEKIDLAGYRIEVDKVEKKGIYGTSVRVILESGGDHLADSEFRESDPTQTNFDQSGQGLALSSKPIKRNYTDIVRIIADSQLNKNVRELAIQIFTRLAEVEARVHGVSINEVHFHELGAVDAIVDIVGACIGVELLGIDMVRSSALHLGGGMIQSSHGALPVPAPATAGLLIGVPVYSSQIKGELVTPTGAAIISTLATEFGELPSMLVQKVGYGAGKLDREIPNLLRLFIGEVEATRRSAWLQSSLIHERVRDPSPEQHQVMPDVEGYHHGPVVVIEANIDDMQPPLYGHLMDRLLEAGALDVLFIPVIMKKNRPGILLQVLTLPDSVKEMIKLIFMESTSIGLRTFPAEKHMLQREFIVVKTEYGEIPVKIARLGEKIVNLSPEYEICRSLADQSDVPLKEILFSAQNAARDYLKIH